ncbi:MULTISPECIES: hypothetical protein [unclassified Methylobacterium]|uniref:hypothetical protein n=1 Tax=unclassified Methylobacterium TaxID=2615210 RepID=UPI00226AE918|nr:MULTISPECIES: hypothetical protein [unclassified Methylobacterium]
MDRLTRVFSNKLEDHPADFRRKTIAAVDVPTGQDRAALETRRDVLRAALTATPGRQSTQAILLLIGSKAVYGASDREIGIKVAAYARALASQPTWAIERAIERLSRPNWRCLWDGSGCPSEADVGAECRYETLPFEAELARIETILDAVPYETGATDGERAGAVAYWEAIKAEMRGESAITERTEDEISAERASMARVNDRFRERARTEAEAQGRGQAIWGRLPISDELARQIGLRVPVPDHEQADIH